MPANRRVIEDRADEAAANLADITRAHANFKSELDSLMRLYKRLGDDPEFHVSEAIAHIERGIDELWCARLAVAATLPDLDATYPGRSAPGSH